MFLAVSRDAFGRMMGIRISRLPIVKWVPIVDITKGKDKQLLFVVVRCYDLHRIWATKK